jgi:hypothetical protein
MVCEACERGDHDQCGMQTWCECDCEGYDPAGRVRPVFEDCNVCGRELMGSEEWGMGMCLICAAE